MLQSFLSFLDGSKGHLSSKCDENFQDDGKISKVGHLFKFQKLNFLTRKEFQIFPRNINLGPTANLASSHTKIYEVRCR